ELHVEVLGPGYEGGGEIRQMFHQEECERPRQAGGGTVSTDQSGAHCRAYLNTDLDVTSADDLTGLAAVLEAGGVFPLHVTRGEDGLWYATFEVLDQHAQPEPSIAAMLAVVESLPEPVRLTWAGCSRREFNIGYDCGRAPRAFNQGLSAELLGRIAAVGASL